MAKSIFIFISGFGATGKSTLGKIISEKFNIPNIGNDEIKEIIWSQIGWEHDKSEWDKVGKMAFEFTYYFVNASLSKGKSIIAEANFQPDKNNERLNELKQKYGCKLLQIHCKADREVIVNRYKERLASEDFHTGRKHAIKNIFGEEKFLSKIGIGSRVLDIEGETLEIDTSNPNTVNYEEIFKFIEKNIKE
ncbi:hypothetical protein A2533_04700 [Candidatus Falkowbacteria bacterium RIFOXYD2_FULL_35_9]|uniref:Gluconokinase n=1 Tax=Candidatus Falkowbacteria bacterium RIFOXYC2_FULL_36_12 TaxID=1798002 RepID=A0A1F5T4L1_9BACT|nr:MAG: hypothetical protein A2478_01675 [Candidatus Falkowbacteria bacterium RIFOXYC2_FULL_36_12]OGF33948.1 MAG: hypothetical protein A2223_03295 [Candidatus Falkowbacteria bacterium RIFOXYA2_FULL_35_8]OGF46072.1 MAG: hypothetical protein A2533_04700 [Candidatus Falkowbacteria bacterium RIFOXYD2_FULL_35_9]